MELRGNLIWICCLAVVTTFAAKDETLFTNYSSRPQPLENLSAGLKVEAESGDVRNLSDTVHQHQLKGCESTEPKKCPEAEVPNNGGLICTTIANNTFCKPMCNHGYDFAFLRRSRVFDVCGEQTGYRWSTQYVGGNKLAVCNEASVQVSGAKSAYFPKGQDCLTTKSSSNNSNNVTETFTAELKREGIQAQPRFTCLLCG